MNLKLKPGDLVAVAFGHEFALAVLVKIINTEAAHIRHIPCGSSSYLVERLEKLEKGEVPMPSINFIQSNAQYRLIPVAEDMLTDLQKRYFKFYRSKIVVNEYKNNRSKYSL